MGYIKMKKDVKINVLHIAICTILEPFGYYEFEKRDEEGWPHFTALKPLPNLKAGAQLDTITAPNAAAGAMIAMLQAAELSSDREGAAAAAKLEAAALNSDLDNMYRDILNFKRLTTPESSLENNERRMGFEQLATPGNPLRLLAEEQLALLDLASGDVRPQ